ncbi:MAG: hypothetical protein L6Q47_06615 [Ignavibacteriaceae bacterium]|nr:hypothetical protein [Ignavibacteriaceae bacterium]
MGGSSESYSYSTSTIYEPDKVKAAEINAIASIKTAKLEGKNIELRKKAAIELIEHNVKMEKLLIEAKLQGFEKAKEALLDFNKKYNLISEQRFRMLEVCQQDVVEDLNKYYGTIREHIHQMEMKHLLEDVPKLLEGLKNYDEQSPQFGSYKTSIDNYMAAFIARMSDWIQLQSEQQSKLVDSVVQLKTELNKEISETVMNRMQLLEKVLDGSNSASGYIKGETARLLGKKASKNNKRLKE